MDRYNQALMQQLSSIETGIQAFKTMLKTIDSIEATEIDTFKVETELSNLIGQVEKYQDGDIIILGKNGISSSSKYLVDLG